jgi:hypothetical protein
MTTSTTDPGDGALAKTILDLEGRRIAAMVKRDFATLDALLADDLSYTHSGGMTDTKGSFLTAIRERKEKYRYIGVDYATADVVGMPGDQAVMVRGRAEIRLEGIPSYPVLFLNVWARRDGSWQMVAWQATRIP